MLQALSLPVVEPRDLEPSACDTSLVSGQRWHWLAAPAGITAHISALPPAPLTSLGESNLTVPSLTGKAMKQSWFKKWGQILVSWWKNSLFSWVGLALIKFTAWSYRHPGFNCGVSYSIVARKSWRLKIISVDNYEGDNPGWNLNYWVLLSIQLLMISNFFNFLLFLNGLHRFLVPQTNGLQSIYVVQIIFLSKSIFYDFWYCHWSIATCVCYLNN